MQVAAQLPLPNLFSMPACSEHLASLDRPHAVQFAGEVLVNTLSLLADPVETANRVCQDPRWKMAVSIANPLSLWGELRFPKIFADRVARMDQVARERGLRGPVGLALASAQRLAQVALYAAHVPASALLEAVDFALQSQVLHAAAQGEDPALARARAEQQLLSLANRRRQTVH